MNSTTYIHSMLIAVIHIRMYSYVDKYVYGELRVEKITSTKINKLPHLKYLFRWFHLV